MSRSVYSDTNRSLVDLLVAARKSAGMTQVELAKVIGKDQSFVSNIERGQHRVGVLEFYAIARAIGRDPVALFRDFVETAPVGYDI